MLKLQNIVGGPSYARLKKNSTTEWIKNNPITEKDITPPKTYLVLAFNALKEKLHVPRLYTPRLRPQNSLQWFSYVTNQLNSQ